MKDALNNLFVLARLKEPDLLATVIKCGIIYLALAAQGIVSYHNNRSNLYFPTTNQVRKRS
jgi:hypothetical protein